MQDFCIVFNWYTLYRIIKIFLLDTFTFFITKNTWIFLYFCAIIKLRYRNKNERKRKSKMKTFNVEYFRKLISTYVKVDGEICGKLIESKSDFYEVLAKKIFISPETVRAWTRPGSKGPSSENLKNLAECLEISPENFFSNSNSNYTSDSNETEIFKMNDFVRNKIYELNKEMIYYFSEIDISSETKFCELSLKIRVLCLALPQEAVRAIESYIAGTLEPFIYDDTSDLGIYCSNVLKAEQQWEELAQKELKPLLFS